MRWKVLWQKAFYSHHIIITASEKSRCWKFSYFFTLSDSFSYSKDGEFWEKIEEVFASEMWWNYRFLLSDNKKWVKVSSSSLDLCWSFQLNVEAYRIKKSIVTHVVDLGENEKFTSIHKMLFCHLTIIHFTSSLYFFRKPRLQFSVLIILAVCPRFRDTTQNTLSAE